MLPTTNYFNTLGYLTVDVPEDVRSVLEEEIREIEEGAAEKVNWQEKLAGVIKEEYRLSKSVSVMERFSLQLALQYDEQFDYFRSIQYATKDVPLCLGSLWVNFQKKHEYNPNHTHTGILSFVIWVRIPYDYNEEEKAFPNQNPLSPHAGNFYFMYTDPLGMLREHNMKITKEWEWKMAIFPASLTHGVYPFFTSDGTRVSVSGNIMLYTG